MGLDVLSLEPRSCPVTPDPDIGAGVVVVGTEACFSRSRIISRSRLRHEEIYSPPSRLDHTKENTEAFSASMRTKAGRAFKLTTLVSAAGETSGNPGFDMTWTL